MSYWFGVNSKGNKCGMSVEDMQKHVARVEGHLVDVESDAIEIRGEVIEPVPEDGVAKDGIKQRTAISSVCRYVLASTPAEAEKIAKRKGWKDLEKAMTGAVKATE